VAEDIRAGYGAGDIIHGVSVQVDPGTVASVVGLNGSGKSTLLKALCGVIRPSAGRVRIGDRDLTGLPPEEIARAGVLVVEQRARAVLAISDYTYVLGGGQVLMADTPARLNASQEFTESFFGVVPQTPQAPKPS
jgi:ABC-type branched-subunit amino acid transport system ATPase component